MWGGLSECSDWCYCLSILRSATRFEERDCGVWTERISGSTEPDVFAGYYASLPFCPLMMAYLSEPLTTPSFKSSNTTGFSYLFGAAFD